jgi:hypothetical protein
MSSYLLLPFAQLRVQLPQSINCLLENGPEKKTSSRSKVASAIVVKPNENVNDRRSWNTRRAAHLFSAERKTLVVQSVTSGKTE